MKTDKTLAKIRRHAACEADSTAAQINALNFELGKMEGALRVYDEILNIAEGKDPNECRRTEENLLLVEAEK